MGPKKGKGNPVIDGVDTSSMTREQLEAFAHRLRNEMEREREERNFFQLERDKLRTFWEITRHQLEESRALLKSKDREVEVAQELAENDVKNVTQQMKHLQYENQTLIGEIRAENMTQLKLAQEDHDKQEHELLNDKRELRRSLRECQENAEGQVQQLKMNHAQLLSEERDKFELELKLMVNLQETKYDNFMQDSTAKHRMEMFDVEERKNFQIQNLINNHEKNFNEMKNYYNDITLNNLALISSLKEQMEELRKQSERNERTVSEVTNENKKLNEPLKEARIELTDLRKKLEHYNRDKLVLARFQKKFTATSKSTSDLKCECEALQMCCEKLTEERDEIKNKFEEAVLELQQKTGLKNVLLERKIKALEEVNEKREAVLGEVLNVAGMAPHALSKRIEKLLQNKNEIIQDVRYELARVCKAHDDLLETYEAKMVQFGIPKEEMGFQPIRTTPKLKLGTGPAGLITKHK